MMKTLIVVMSAVLLFIPQLRAQDPDSPWEPALPEGKGNPGLERLKQRLSLAYATISTNATPGSLDLHTKAIARIEAVEPLITRKPQSKVARREFVTCSLLTEAAIAQIRARDFQLSAGSLQERLRAALMELDTIHESINAAERSYASKLRTDLDAEKEQARLMREDAEKKFSELQSALIQVSKDARGTIISMSDILFDVGRATLTPDLRTSLARIAGILLVYRGSRIIVEGHTDNVGGERFNQELSEQRAMNVMNFLIEQGVVPDRLSFRGFGFTRPIADNETKEGRQRNRRVDLVVQERPGAEGL